MNKKNIHFKITLPFLMLFIFQLILINQGLYSISADESGHTLNAYYYYQGTGGIYGMWLPGQQIIYSTVFHVWCNLVWTPRIVSILFSLFALGNLMLLTKELFHNENITFVSGVLGSLFVGFVLFGILPLTEIYFFAFVLLTIYLMLYYLRTDKRMWLLILSGIITTTFRFDGWLFVLVISFFLYKKLKYRTLLFFVFPFLWMITGYLNTGELFGFVHKVAERRIGIKFNESMIYSFVMLSVESLLLFGIYHLNKNKKYLILFVTTFLIWLITLMKTGAMPTHNIWRVSLFWVIMLIPFLAYMIQSLKKPYGQILLFVALCLSVIQTTKYANAPQIFVLNKYTVDLGKEIQQLEGTFVMPKMGWEYANVLVASQNPSRITYLEKINSLDLKNHNYLIFPRELNGFRKIYSNHHWYIYKIDN